jgi:hypothetical protein
VRPARSVGDGRIATTWLPAHEVSGEGVFLELRANAIDAWLRAQTDGELVARRRAAEERFDESYMSTSPLSIIMSQDHFVLVHTIAHLMIREMAFSAGYSAASIRERIYLGAPDRGFAAGILLFTAQGDSEGTLGGLVRLGEPERLSGILSRMVERAAWCSQDPVCRESRGQGTQGLNLAACHGCCLLPESSCDHGNVLLDRNSVTSAKSNAPGFMDPILAG